MRARLAPSDPATNDDALVEHTVPARRRPRRRLWCALGAAVLAVAVLAKAWVRGEVWLAYVFPTQTVWDRVHKGAATAHWREHADLLISKTADGLLSSYILCLLISPPTLLPIIHQI